MRLLVTGGYFDDSGEGFVDRLDLTRGTRERLLSFVPPEPHRLAGKGFTGASWLDDDSLLVCSFDAVWRFAPSTGRVTGRIHQADFNDLHDVAVDLAAARIYVCNTGLDALEIFDLAGTFVGRSATSPAWFEAARQHGAAISRSDFPQLLAAGWHATERPALAVPAGAYYKAATDEPFHRRKARDYLHPNHVVRWGDHLVATMLASRELRCMRCHRTLAQLAAHPHDGVLVGEDLWVTTTDGRIWKVTPNGEPSLVVDVATTGHLGWCRGLAVTEDSLAVGLTALHAVPQYAWRPEPRELTETSVVWLERGTGQLRGRVAYEDAGRPAKVFALLPTRGVWA
ncbi:MAG: hypothetical protein ABL886_11195 [Rhodoglobus sp.]